MEISAFALLYNYRLFRRLAGKTAGIMAVVKANAYGHGMAEVAKILATSASPKSQVPGSKTDSRPLWFGVDSGAEALALRGIGISEPILVLGLICPEEFRGLTANNVSFVLARKEDIDLLPPRAKFQIKIETGTNRLGFFPQELPFVIRRLERLRKRPEGFYTHFADAENTHSRFWKRQLVEFRRAEGLFLRAWSAPLFKHASATAAALQYPSARFDIVRVGIGLYGLEPDPRLRALPVVQKLRPVLSWKTRTVQVKKVLRGATVGYDRTFRARRPMTIAVLPVGYWDGYDRGLSSRGVVLLRGKRARVIGRVCMNMTMVDVSDVPRPGVGEEVTLLGKSRNGEEITVANMARQLHTITYEVVTRINPLIPRVIVL
ncbi:MAG: alanine racemase [Parcubacteria group bacterium]|nr:alanine racemase [Parcubacteria group bacterium]